MLFRTDLQVEIDDLIVQPVEASQSFEIFSRDRNTVCVYQDLKVFF